MKLAEYPSKSSPGKVYTVTEGNDGVIYCDCWQWKKNRDCQHIQSYYFTINSELKAPKDDIESVLDKYFPAVN